ncbi:MAG: regulatory iron-sulfur-containing complex subunit RicT [Ginsengibacter sp.]
MGCTSCGTGKPNGCKSNGGCSSGGCNRLNVHDWLADLPLPDNESACKVAEISFNQGSRKDFYRNNTPNFFSKGDIVAVEGISGFDVGTVNLTGEIVRLQLKKKRQDENNPDFKRILRLATEGDIAKWKETKLREKQVLIRSRAMARQLNLNLKMSEVEIQADSRKATFYYIADERVDFRELIRLYANEFKVKVEMKQIGARQEAGKIGGIGSCGRELCCSTWLTDFKSVNTNAARYQNLSINQTKLSGQCGRLKCCLNYELDTYLDALQHFPDDADVIEVAKGRAFLVKKDIFRNLMWYTMADSTKHYPLSIETVKDIQEQNKKGIKPAALETVEIISGKPKEVEPEFVDVVGQITLKSLEKNSRKRKNTGSQKNSPNNTSAPRDRQKQRPQENNRRPNNNKRNQNRNPPKD